MVFYLQMAEIDKARGVAQKAIKTILYNEEQERLNVWVALLNLEMMYGTQATLDDVFNRATQNCDSYKIHCHLAEIYARASKIEVILFIIKHLFFDNLNSEFSLLRKRSLCL